MTEALSGRDFDAIHGFLRGAYAATDLPSLGGWIVTVLPRLIRSEIATYSEMNARTRQSSVISVPTVAEIEAKLPGHLQIFDRYMREHPIVAHHLRTGDRSPHRISDFLSRQQYQRLGLYNELFRPLRAEYQLGFLLPGSSPVMIGVALHRDRRDFSDRERLLADLLRPHLAQAHLNASASMRLRERLAMVTEAFEACPFGMLILDERRRIRWASGRTLELLTTYFGTAPLHDRLPETLDRYVAHHLGTARSGAPASRMPLVVAREQDRLVVRLVTPPQLTLLLLEKVETCVDTIHLRSSGLSPRQAEIVTWIVQGETSAQIGTRLGISARTVDKHVEHILARLGVATRPAAVARALALAIAGHRGT